MERKWNPKTGLLLWGGVLGLVAAALAFMGNPGNMAFCIACFIRDIAGACKLHTAAAVQYMRPEIAGLAAGSFVISLMGKEYRSTSGSSPMIRFLLGVVTMIGALVFLGCPLRMVLRMAAGDWNAYVGLAGFVLGAATGCFFLKKGFSLGRAYDTRKESGYILPAILAVLFLLSILTPLFAASAEGPGSMHAPVFASLAGGCPLRQLILAGQGSGDAAVNVLGMLAGAAFCHNFGLASSGTGTTPAGRLMCAACIAVLFVIGFSCKRKSDK